MESRPNNSMAALNNNNKNSGEDSNALHRLRENTDDSESNISFNSNNDDEPILTATITFDVTVDPNGQVISTSEGQIISETFQNPHDGRALSLSSHHRQFDEQQQQQQIQHQPTPTPPPSQQHQALASSVSVAEEKTRNVIRDDSLTSLNSGSNRKDTTLHDSLDEVETDEDTSSTSTESLIERSKKYMNQEAGIIILKRDNLTAQNFNINLDFDLKNDQNADTSGQQVTSETDPGKSFNINLDFDIHSNREGMSGVGGDDSSLVAADGSKGFNINLDFDIKDGNVVPRRSIQDVKKTGVGIDLMITSNSTGEKLDEKTSLNEINQEISNLNSNNMNTDAYDDTLISSVVTYHYVEEPYDTTHLNDSLNKDIINSSNINDASSRINAYEGADSTPSSKDININSRDLINQYERLMERTQQQNNSSNTLEEDTARIELIDRMVQRSSQLESAQEKDAYYAKNIPKVSKFTLEDCIEQILESGGEEKEKALNSGSMPVLRSFETVDFDALTKGFDPEEVKEGKLVLYITEAQLLQLLKQRAIIIPDKNKLFAAASSRDRERDTSRTSRVSLVDEKIQDKLGRQSPVNTVELVIDRNIQTLDEPNQDQECTESKIDSPCPDPQQQATTPLPNDIPSCSQMQTPCQTPHQTPRQTICQTPSDIPCQTPQPLPQSTPPPSAPPSRQSQKTPVPPISQSTHSMDSSSSQQYLPSPQRDNTTSSITQSNLTTQSIGEDCKRLFTFDQSEKALSIIREYIDRTSKDLDNCDLTPRRSSIKPSDEVHKSPRVFNAFLNKIFDDSLKNRLIRDSAFEKGLDLLTELVDHVVDDASQKQQQQQQQMLDSYVEKGKVFESFTDYVHKNIPTYTEKTKQTARDEQINQVMKELSEFYNEALDCNGRRRSTIESHAEKVLKILGDFVDKELDEDFNGRLFTDEQSDMALTIIKDHLIDTIDECYHKQPGSSRLQKTYDRIDDYIDNFLQTKQMEKKSPSVKSFERIDNVIDTILQNRLSSATEKSLDRSDNTSNYNILQSRASFTTAGKSEHEKTRQDSMTDSARLSSCTQKSLLDEKKQKNYERIDHAVDIVLQNRLSLPQETKRCASTNSYKSLDAASLTTNRLLTDAQSDKVMSMIKDYVMSSLDECGKVRLDDSQRSSSSLYERKTISNLTEKSSDLFYDKQSLAPRIFDSFLNAIFDDNLKNRLKRNNSYQKGLNLLTEFVDHVTSHVKRVNPPFDPFVERGKLFETFSEFVSKNIPEFRLESSMTLVFPSCVDEKIKKALRTISDFYDDVFEFNGAKVESHEEKAQRILGDFVERISNHFFSRPYVGVEERSAQLPNMVGYRDKLSHQTDMAPKIFDTFLNKIFDDNLKNKLISDNSFDKGLSILTDLTDYVTTNVKSMNPSYDTFLENGKLFERFSEYVHKNISAEINLDASPPPKTASIALCTDERLKRVTDALSNFYDNALDCNGKRRPTIESNAEKIQKILGDFVDRISNHYYNEPMLSVQEKQMEQIESRTMSDLSRVSKVVEPSVDAMKKIDDFIDHVLEKHKFKVEKGNEVQQIQTASSVSIVTNVAKKPEKVAVSVIHQNISAKKTPETCYISDLEKTYKPSMEQMSKPLTIDAYQPSINKIATAYDGVKLISPTVAQLNDGKLLKYKDFDLMVPSDYHFRETSSSSSDSKSHLDYIVAGSDGSDNYKSLIEKTQVNFPKSYEFLNQGLNFVDKTEEDALSELDKFFQQLVSNLDKDTQRINWPVINKFYSTKDQREKADIIKKFINGLATEVKPEIVSGIIVEDKSKSLPDKTGQTLKILDNFVDHVLEKKPITHKITDKEAINLISDLINRLREFLKNWKPIKYPELKKILNGNLDNKIIIKTTKKLPAKISVTGNSKQQQFIRKKITYSYLDNYNPSTRVYELVDTEQLENVKGDQAIDLFNTSKDLNYLLKPFDPAIAESIGKPSLDQINKYLSVVNTGVKNTDLIQIHPLLNSQTTIKNQSRAPSSADNHPKLTEPVIIDSSNYQKYVDDVSKHFSGLQITDFPLYVQGLEFKQSDPNNTTLDSAQQTFIHTTKEASPPKPADGVTIPEPNNFYTKQVASNSGNIQYVRVKSSNQIIVAQ